MEHLGRTPPPRLPVAPGGYLQAQSPQRPPHPLSASSEAGRMKTEQVVLEFLFKAAELIVQSRASFQSDADQRRGARRARFNLDIEEVQCVREAMAAWREDVHLPLAISVFVDAGGRRVLLEQWVVVYAPADELDQQHPLGARRGAANPQLTGAARDVIQQLKEVCKKISVLLRTLYAFMRLLPAHRLFRRSFPSNLSYEIHTTSSAQSPDSHFERDEPISRYSFVPITTPFGYLKISAVYRLNCELLAQEEEAASQPAILKENFIIQDYVPSSPELLAQREPPLASATTSVSPSIAIPRPSAVATSPPDTDDSGHFDERRRRSSPAPVVDDFAIRRSQSLSRPMAIPQAKTPTVFEESVLSPRESNKVIHAHSYGDPDRLRAIAANPNVAAAPYGYGNVAVERGNTPPAAHWTGSGRGGGSTGSGGGSSMAGRYGGGGSSPGLTPPFTYAEAPQVDSPRATAALVLHRSPAEAVASSGGRGALAFGLSPPFQANPTELLSTSPGYSHSKNFIREGPSSLPMFVTTNRFQLGRNPPLMLNPAVPGFSKSAGPSLRNPRTNHLTQARGFSSDLYEAGSGVWGVSPDSPDAFGLSLTDPSGNYYRHRFLSSSSSVGGGGGGENGSASQYDPDDISDLMLPFAIGDMDSNSAATTLTSTAGSEAGRPSGGEFSASDAQGSRNGASWDTASVGSFLNQLKHAPRLRVFQDGAPDIGDQHHHNRLDGDSGRDASESTPQAPSGRSAIPQLLFEDELASFRNLRDELARDL